MKKEFITILVLTLIAVCITACKPKEAQQTNNAVAATENTQVAGIQTYEFETFDGYTLAINEGNLVSQEPCDNPLEWDGLPENATQLAPGKDVILFEDEVNYYVEDATNKLVTIAFKELGDVIEDTGITVFDNNVFTFQFDANYFVVNEDSECVTVSFYNEGTQTAGSNTITFKQVKNANAMDVAKDFAKQYGVEENEIHETIYGASEATAYTFSVYPSADDTSENKTRSMCAAVVAGNDVIVIEVLNHVEPDEGMDMYINDMLAFVLDTFSVNS